MFEPAYRLTPRIHRQLLTADYTRGFLDAVRLRPEGHADLRHRTRVREVVASLRIEGNSLTFEEAYALVEAVPERELLASEHEFVNYLRAFEAIDRS